MSLAPLSERAKALILDAEGLNRPGKWPGGASGITIGYGYDLGQVKVERFVADWGELLPVAQVKRLKAAIGLQGAKAQAAASGLADIVIKEDVSLKVFLSRTIPEYQRQTEAAFPGLAKLAPDAQGALVSLVYNRGPSMTGDRRKEMRAIRDAVAQGDLKEIASQLRAMKRLWRGQGLPGLLKRRDAEAALVESCL